MDSFYLPQHGLNISRSELPQVAGDDVPDYLNWLKTHKNISYTFTEMPCAALYPSQGNFNQEKIEGLLSQDLEGLRKPIIVSGDHYVLDGHHRWIALLNLDSDSTIPVYFVHAKILDLIAATKEYPKSFTRSVVESFRVVTEAAEKHGVLAYGRMNPPTTGHAKLVDKVHEVAKAHNATHKVVLSHSQDAKKNPLSQSQKVKHASRFFPHTHIVAASKKSPTIFHHAAEMHKKGIKHLHVIAGDDRVKEYHDHLHKYNGHFDKEGHGYKFKSITVHSAGKRDPKATGTEGMSASKMREHAHSGKFHEFKKGIPSHVSHEHAKELYHDVRKGMGHLHEEPETLLEGVHDAAIFKAVFLAGAPGSGKDFVLKKSLHGHGLTEVNSDTALEHLMDKLKLDKKMPEHEQERRNVVRDRAKSLTELKQRLALHGRNGLIINSTGATHDKIKKIKDMLDGLGYDSKMIFVDASDNVSRNRNVERGQRGGRMIPEKIRAEKWRQAQDARVKFAQMFGGEHYHEFNNDEDLRHNADPEIASQKTSELDDLHKVVRKFTQQPPKSEHAQQWIHTNLGKLAKMPVGNKTQQAKVTPPPSDSKAKEEADKLGLKWLGHGRYGKDGRVTHFTLHDRLVEKQKALKPPVVKDAKKPAQKLNEEFEQLFTEDTDYVTQQPVQMDVPRQYLSSFTRRLGVPGMPAGSTSFRDLRDLQEESGKEAPQEKVDYRTFRGRLVLHSGAQQAGAQEEILQEGEAITDPGTEPGPPLGGRPAEVNDMSAGGLATPVQKKTLKHFLKKKGLMKSFKDHQQLDETKIIGRTTTGPRTHYKNKKGCAGCGKTSSYDVNNSINKFCRQCQAVDSESLKAKSTGLYKEESIEPKFQRATKTETSYNGMINGKTFVVPHHFHDGDKTTPMRFSIVTSPVHVQHNNPTLTPEEAARVHQHIKDIHGGQEVKEEYDYPDPGPPESPKTSKTPKRKMSDAEAQFRADAINKQQWKIFSAKNPHLNEEGRRITTGSLMFNKIANTKSVTYNSFGKIVKPAPPLDRSTMMKEETLEEGRPIRGDVFDHHQTLIAKKTLRMPDAMVGVMGGPNKEEARAHLRKKGWTKKQIHDHEHSQFVNEHVWNVTDHLGHKHEVEAKDHSEAMKKTVSVGGVHKEGIPMTQWRKVRIEKKNLEEKVLTDAETAKKEEIVKSMKKKVQGFKDRYGDRAKDVMYATATKQAKKLAEDTMSPEHIHYTMWKAEHPEEFKKSQKDSNKHLFGAKGQPKKKIKKEKRYGNTRPEFWKYGVPATVPFSKINESFMSTYRRNENANRHTANIVHLAKHFGSKDDQAQAKFFADELKRHGHQPHHEAAYNLQAKLLPKAMKAHGIKEEVEQLDEATLKSSHGTADGHSHVVKSSFSKGKFSGTVHTSHRDNRYTYTGPEARSPVEHEKPKSWAHEVKHGLRPSQIRMRNPHLDHTQAEAISRHFEEHKNKVRQLSESVKGRIAFRRLLPNYSQGRFSVKWPKPIAGAPLGGKTGSQSANTAPVKEETEQLDELSKSTLGDYVNRAATDTHYHAYRAGSQLTDAKGRSLRKSRKRLLGISSAVKKLAKEEHSKTFDVVKGVLNEIYTRKHFRQVADIIAKHPDAAKRRELAAHHTDIFSKSNPRFDKKRFYAAANAGEAQE